MSANIAVPELKAFTITVWMKTEQDGTGTLLSYATKIQSEELVIRTHPRIKLTFKGSSTSELSATLNDGRWHFVCIQWQSSNGKLRVFVDKISQSTITTTLGRGRKLERRGYLVLGRKQKPRENLLEKEAFVGEIAYFNLWSSEISFLDKVKKDCEGIYEGNVIRWSVTTANGIIDTHHTAAVIKADVVGMCSGKNSRQFGFSFMLQLVVGTKYDHV